MSLHEKMLDAASRGDSAEIQRLLATGQVDDHDKSESLLSAAEAGHADVVRALIGAETDLGARNYEGFSAVALAASKGHGAVAEMLETAGAASDGLVWAAGITGREALLDRALSLKEDIGRCTEDGTTALHYAAGEGHERLVARLLSLGADLEAEDRQNRTPVTIAARKGQLGVVKALAERGADVKQALVAAALGGYHDVVAECIARGAPIDTRDNYAETALHKAAENGDEPLVKLLLEHRATIERPSINSTTPLMQAANRGHSSVVKLLLQRGASVNQTTDVKETALSYAARWGHVETLEVLLSAGAIILASGRYNPLVVASREGHPAAARRLLEAGADVNYEYDGETALSGAARQGHAEVVTLLLERGAKINDNAVSEAAERGQAEIVKLFFDRGAALPEGFMHKAAEGGQAELVKLALKHGLSAHERGGYWDRTPLAAAAAAGSVEAVRVLLDAGANANVTDRDGKTAVRLAMDRGAEDVARLLESRGALAERPQLFTAAARGDASTVEVMLAQKANPNVRVKGRTPLHEAAALGHIEAVRALLLGKASPDLIDEDGWTALMDACDFGHADVATALLDANADPFVADHAGYTAYRLAKRGEHQDIVGLFERREVDRDWRPDLAHAAREGDVAALEKLAAKGRPIGILHQGESILHAAASSGQLGVVKLAIDKGVGVDQKDSSERTAVMRAASGGHPDVVRELLARGADPRAADSYDSALTSAAASGYTEVVRALVEAGAAASLKDPQGRRALDRALEYDREETALALLKLGADADEGTMRAALKHASVVTALVKKGLRLPSGDAEARALALKLWKHGVAAEFDDPVEALLDSVAYDDLEVVKGLVEEGLDVNCADEDGTTPLLKARARGDKDIEKLLKKRGAKAVGVLLELARTQSGITAKTVKSSLADGDRLDIADGEGRMALHWAAKHGDAKALKALLAAKPPLDALTAEGKTPLLLALEGDHWDAAKLLVDAGADPALGPEEEWSAAAHYLRDKKLDRAKELVKRGASTKWLMHAAAGSGSLEAIAFAKASGASAEVVTATGWNAARAAAASGERKALDEVLRLGSPRNGVLHGAAASGKVALVRYALNDLGAAVNDKDDSGRTALYEAAFTTTDVVEALLDAGADPNLPDEDGWTPLFIACDHGDVDVIKLFIARGAHVGHANARGETVLDRARWGSEDVKKALGIAERPSYGGHGDDDEDR